VRQAVATTFRSLSIRNYRLFFLGQLVSVSGTWMQVVALGWLVLELSGGSAVAVGVVTALQQVPMLVLGAWGGVLADRFDKRRTLVTTQAVAAASALALAALTFSDLATVPNVTAVVVVAGLAQVVDLPTRQAFISEMVGPEHLINAVGLNSAVFNATRILGPAVAGALLVTVGAAWCFLLNGISFVAVILGLLAMRPAELRPSPLVARAKGQVREGLRYIARTPELRANLVLMTITGTLAINFPVVLPVLATDTFDGDAGTYGLLTAAMGVGALVGALLAASRRTITEGLLIAASVAFGAASLVSSVAPTLEVLVPLLVVTGAVNITMFATSNTLLQLQADPTMRGRVLAVRGMTVLGTTPIGAPITGWVCEAFGPRWGLVMGGVATLLAAAWLWASVRNRPLPVVDTADAPPDQPPDVASDPALA
jgi:MFS family permease